MLPWICSYSDSEMVAPGGSGSGHFAFLGVSTNPQSVVGSVTTMSTMPQADDPSVTLARAQLAITCNQAHQSFIQYVMSAHRLVSMSESSVHLVARTAEEVPEIWRDEEPAVNSYGIESLDVLLELTQAEVDADFPLLHNHTLVGLWGALEAYTSDIAVNWVEHLNPREWGDDIAKMKIKLGDWVSLPEDQRSEWLVDQIRRTSSSDLKAGIGQFESVFNAIGLDGPVDDAIRTVLFQTKALRNVIAHRGGRADARFVADCSDFGTSVGDEVRLSRLQLAAALEAMTIYANTVANRINTYLGHNSIVHKVPEPLKSIEALRMVILPANRWTKDPTTIE